MMGLLSTIFSNTRKPHGFWGKMMVAGMNGGSHAKMASWGLDLGNVPAEGEIIDIGCGGGANLSRLMDRSPKARVTGVDYSEVSVAKSRKVNAAAVDSGRCKVLQASVASLPFADGTFTMATAFETIYFWPDIEKSFAEVRRVLAPGGNVMSGIPFESYGYEIMGFIHRVILGGEKLAVEVGETDYKGPKNLIRYFMESMGMTEEQIRAAITDAMAAQEAKTKGLNQMEHRK